MGKKLITKAKLENVHHSFENIALVTADTIAAGWQLPFDGEDFKTLFLMQGGAVAGKVTFLMGDGIQAVTDLEVAVPAGKLVGITLDSGSFKHMSGTLKGCVAANPSHADIRIAVVELP